MDNSTARDASVFTELIEYTPMTQESLEKALQRRDEMMDDRSDFQYIPEKVADNPDDEGYNSTTSPTHPISVSSDGSSGGGPVDCEIHDDCCTDIITDELFEYLTLHELSTDSGSDACSCNGSQDANALFQNMSTGMRDKGILDQTVPEDKIQDLFPLLNDISHPGDFEGLEVDLTKESVLESAEWYSKEHHNEPLHSVKEASLPEFNLLLDNNYEDISKQVTINVNEGQQVEDVKCANEETYSDVEEDEEEDDEEDEDYDPDDEDYIPSSTRKSHLAKHSPRSSQNQHIYRMQLSNKRSRRHSPQLWVFLLNCLCDTNLNPSVIAWEDRKKGIFRLKNSKRVAELWGNRLEKVQKKAMDYEKFSRAIRYYYHKNVIKSHPKKINVPVWS